MPYTINLSNGNVLTVIPDDTLDNSTSLTLLGRSFVGYGEIIAEDFVHVLENFANISPPSAPLRGQLWYNTDNGVLSLYTGSVWEAVGSTSTGITIEQTTNSGGGLMFYDPEAPTNSRYYRIRIRDDGQYSGHLVIESLNDNNTVKTTVLDSDNLGNIVLKNLTVHSITSNGIAIQETTSSSTGLTFYDSLAPSNSRLFRIRVRDDAPYSGHLVIETLNDVGTIQNVVFDSDNAGTIVMPNLTVTGNAVGVTLPASDSSTKFATTAFVKTNTRILLRTILDLYVGPGGNDSNDGLTPTTAFLTLQRATIVAYANYDTEGFDIRINLVAGNYTSGANCHYQLVGGGKIIYLGNTSNPTSVWVSLSGPGACFNADQGAHVSVSGIAMSAPYGQSSLGQVAGECLTASIGGTISFDHCVFGASQRSHIEVGMGGWITANGPYTITGGAACHWISGFGTIVATGQTITLTGTPNFSAQFAWAEMGHIFIPSTTFNGNATGVRYVSHNGGLINTGSGRTDYIPGSLPGDSSTGYYT